MSSIALVILLGIVGAYVLHLVAVAWGVMRVRRAPVPPEPDRWPFASIVVPARNEADAIDACLDSLLASDYPADRFEVIVVDDFSTDATPARVRRRMRTAVAAGDEADDPDDAPTVRLVKMAEEMPENGGHKPEAVAQGIDAARGDVVLTTDADCRVESGWLRSMVRRCTPETPFVAGPVQYDVSHRWLDRLQALEFTGLIAYGAGTLGLGRPTFCNSANVAVRRDVLNALDGAPDGAARDEMLLQHVAYETDREVAFNPDPDALVTTQPTPDLRSYLHQQARWASMGTRYPYLRPRLYVLLLWAAHAVLFAGTCAAVALPAWQPTVMGAFLTKFAADALLTVPLVKHFGQDDLLRSSVGTELLMLWAVPLVGLMGTFGAVEWKGREIG